MKKKDDHLPDTTNIKLNQIPLQNTKSKMSQAYEGFLFRYRKENTVVSQIFMVFHGNSYKYMYIFTNILRGEA